MPLGLNLAAVAMLVAVLASGTEPGGLGARWLAWPWPAGVSALVGLAAFRFPRSVGLPLVVLVAVGVWAVSTALTGFVPLGPGVPSVRVQPLTDRETVTAFALRTDFLTPPVFLTSERPTLVRVRPGDAPPAEWWWPWIESRHWGRSVGAPMPPHPLKYAVYQLSLAPESSPSWRLEDPELLAPGP